MLEKISPFIMKLPDHFFAGILIGLVMFIMAFVQFHSDPIRSSIAGATMCGLIWICPKQDCIPEKL
jgi:hypothetical protein